MGNKLHAYTDIEAVHVMLRTPRTAAARNLGGLPIAVTEAHLGSTREEQLRWLKEFGMPPKVRREVDVRAVTAWSLWHL